MNTRRALTAGALLLAAAAAGANSAVAQCTLNGTIRQFEPNPPGASRLGTLNWIWVSGFNLNQPAGGSPRLLVTESFGYQQVDLTDPANPQAIFWEDYRYTPIQSGCGKPECGAVPYSGDGHSSINAVGISDDGARSAFALSSDADSPNGGRTMLGVTTGTGQIALMAETAGQSGSSIAVQHLGSRYLEYTLSNTAVYVSDATTLPVSLNHSTNYSSETIGTPGGSSPTLAGPYLAYLGTSGTINLINVSSPGPVGSIVSGFSSSSITSTDPVWGRPSTERIYAFHAAADPQNSSAIYILAEFANPSYQSAGYSLIRYVGGTATFVGTYKIPVQSGEQWGLSYTVGLYQYAGNLYALMWGNRTAPTQLYRLFSVAVASFGSGVVPGQVDVDPARYSGFKTGFPMAGLPASNNLYLYVPSAQSGWVVPLSCVSPDSPPASDLVVQPVPCPGGGGGPCPLNANDAVFVGTTLQITPQVATAKPITDWRFDYDLHPAEDNGNSSPRIRNADLFYPATLPVPITLVGPCDPRTSGVPSTGAGCWASETSNGDFASGAPAGTSKVLTLALEAANANGYGNLKTLPLTWKVPAVRLQNPNVLLGQPLVSGSDGTPSPSGFKWYFGTSPDSLTQVACSGATCMPTGQFAAKGTYYWWLTVPYPTGYTSPDCGSPCTQNLGTFSVTDVSLAFTGIPTTAVAGAGLNVTDASSAASGATTCGGGLQYSFCDASAGACSASSWQSLLISPLGSGLSTNISAPSSAGTYWLRVHYSYTTSGSCGSPLTATWTPGVSGLSDATAWRVVVTPLPPTIQVLVNGVNPCIGAGGGCSGGVPANIGDTVTVKAWLGFNPDSNPPPSTAWAFGAGASPSSCSGTGCQGTIFTYTAAGNQTISLSGYPGIADPAATVLMSVSVPAVVASNSTLPSGVCAGSSVTLTASPTVTGATYAWTGTNNFSSALQCPVLSPATSGTYTVTRTISGQPSSTSSTTTVVIVPPPVPTAGNNGPVCSGQTLSLSAASIAGATYAWTGPNGFSSSQQNPSIANATAAASGTYFVTATVNGCSTAASTTAAVNAPPAAPAAGNSGPLCVGGNLQLTASAIANATYAWTGPNGFTSTLQNPSIANVTPGSGGTYSVTATVSGCTGPAGTTVAVVNGSSAAITVPSNLCLPNVTSGTASVADAGAGATYAWTVTNGTIASGQGTASIAFSVSAAGTTTVAVVVTAGGCVSSSSVPVAVSAQCGGLNVLTPCRVLDTRNPNGSTGGPSIGPSSGRRFFATGVCGIPPGMTALSANVTVVSQDAQGSIVAYPGDLPTPPNAITVTVRQGQTRANNAIVKLASDGSFWIWNTTAGTVDVILDVNGTFQ